MFFSQGLLDSLDEVKGHDPYPIKIPVWYMDYRPSKEPHLVLKLEAVLDSEYGSTC